MTSNKYNTRKIQLPVLTNPHRFVVQESAAGIVLLYRALQETTIQGYFNIGRKRIATENKIVNKSAFFNAIL